MRTEQERERERVVAQILRLGLRWRGTRARFKDGSGHDRGGLFGHSVPAAGRGGGRGGARPAQSHAAGRLGLWVLKVGTPKFNWGKT